ncbi:MAG TPA: hypothetical protein VKX35_04275, partial [Fermentimonas sp.]|nr:hypothetical protein [Fermentimonas sp.]
MRKLLFTGFLAIAMIVGVNAQKAGYDYKNAPYGHGEDSVNCRVNLSLMQTAAKAESYEEALIPWSSVYENCPGSSKNIYIYGPRIFKSLFEKETDPAKKKEYLDKTMEIYDNRLKYFGDDDAEGTVLAFKTYDYMEMMGDQADQSVIYSWLSKAVNDMKDQMYPLDAYSYLMVSSISLYLNDNSLKDQYITDYFNVVGYVDQAIANSVAENNQANADYLAMVKEGIVQGFVNSGAGDCKTLNEYYADKVEPNKANKEFLNEVIAALASVGCNDSDLYFTASEY